MLNNVTVGTDTEMILYKDGKPYPVIGLLGGTKRKPIKIKNGAYQEDNVMAEFNIDPARNAREFSDNIESVINQVKEILPDYELRAIPSAEFEFSSLFMAGDKAFEFGCDPDRDAWSGRINDSPDPDTNLRTCGGHIHVGWEHINDDNIRDVIKMMDIYLGIPSVLLDEDTRRRDMYGKAGAYRKKRYGVEYRTLSNFWVSSRILSDWVYNMTIKSLEDLEKVQEMEKEIGSERIINTINSSDQASAYKIISEFDLLLP